MLSEETDFTNSKAFLVIDGNKDDPSVSSVVSPQEEIYQKTLSCLQDNYQQIETELLQYECEYNKLCGELEKQQTCPCGPSQDLNTLSGESEEKDVLPLLMLSLDPKTRQRIELEALTTFPDYNSERDCPDEFRCPISKLPFNIPVMEHKSAITYDERSLNKDRESLMGNPNTGPNPESYTVNYALKSLMEEYESSEKTRVQNKRKEFIEKRTLEEALNQLSHDKVTRNIAVSQLLILEQNIQECTSRLEDIKDAMERVRVNRLNSRCSELAAREASCYRCHTHFSWYLFCYTCPRCTHGFCGACCSYYGRISNQNGSQWNRICTRCYNVNRRRHSEILRNTLPGDEDDLPSYDVKCATDKISYYMQFLFAQAKLVQKWQSLLFKLIGESRSQQ